MHCNQPTNQALWILGSTGPTGIEVARLRDKRATQQRIRNIVTRQKEKVAARRMHQLCFGKSSKRMFLLEIMSSTYTYIYIYMYEYLYILYISMKSEWLSPIYSFFTFLIIHMLISIISHNQPSPESSLNHRIHRPKSQVYEKRPGNDADDIDISEVSEFPFGITASLYQPCYPCRYILYNVIGLDCGRYIMHIYIYTCFTGACLNPVAVGKQSLFFN